MDRGNIHGNGQRRHFIIDPSSDDLTAFFPHIIVQLLDQGRAFKQW